MTGTSLRFAAAARVVADRLRADALVVPAFRSPPRIAGQRSIRRLGVGVTIAVRYRDRPWPAVLADLVEGAVVANALDGAAADDLRTVLWAALDERGQLGPSTIDPARDPDDPVRLPRERQGAQGPRGVGVAA